ncbi:MAG: 2,3-bisphosphoglycerate-independent phosphoglycerate mutase [Candidatus Beckwithbacteria bacterium]|nr:2,3-bisphosphoglycerate-independent phosphoglycerate mutase [Candidatus Beckwithbacteria bacterium]
MNNYNPVVLIIMDGWGIAPPSPGNAITQAQIPYFNKLLHAYPSTQLIASGEAVGLPHGDDGNTEVGHINLGAGQIVFQDLPRINTAIADGSFFQNETLLKTITYAKTNHSYLHLLGLVGSGGVHANNEHLFALIKLAKLQNISKLSLHLFTDGRDSPPTTSQIYLAQIEQHLKEMGIGKIASVTGRYYAMDRDFRWDRTEKAYLCLTEGVGKKVLTPSQAVENSYASGKSDEFIEPTIITDGSGTPLSLIKDNDAVIFYNFRVDRPRQLTKAFVLPDFEAKANELAFDPLSDKYLHSHLPQKASVSPPFKRHLFLKNLFFSTMTEYQSGLPVQVAFKPMHVDLPLSRILSEANLTQLKIAETEKERFVTYYFNGLREQPFSGEDWEITPSPKIATYDLQPEMSTPKLTQILNNKLKEKQYSFIAINLACPDMVAHTGSLAATIKACEAVDLFLSQTIPTILSLNGTALITADHGNAEELINLQTGAVDTEHSANPVPFIAVSNNWPVQTSSTGLGILADVAPTVLKILHLPKPESMTGKTLL